MRAAGRWNEREPRLHTADVIRIATPADLPALRELFSSANDAPCNLAEVASEKCFEEGASGAPVATIFDAGGPAAGAAVTCGRYLRLLIVDRRQRRRGVATALLEEAESRGVSVVAAEPGNYLTPGIAETDRGSVAFFQARGYRPARSTWNLEVVLDGISAPAGPRRAEAAESERVLEFIAREFGRIWRFEAGRAFQRALPTLFITEAGGEITGFAAHDANNRGQGFFGPTGVAVAMRGRGLGSQLTLASLADLHRMGHDRAVIPWTDALDFYRKCCGATPAHRFVTFEKPRR